MRDVLVICTRNRRDDLMRCLSTVAGSLRLPAGIVIVDSSDTDASGAFVREWAENVPETLVRYVKSPPGLTIQRNAALQLVRDYYDIIHFLDDDVSVSEDYFASIISVFEENSDCAGVGGHVEGWWNQKPARLIDRLGGLDSATNGAVTRAGFSCIPRSTAGVSQVHWLSGCCMSFRTNSIRGLEFDGSRLGYGLGEDVDFTMRVAERGSLLHATAARLSHHQSPVNRFSQREIIRQAVRHRWALADAGLGEVRHGWVVLGSVFESLRFAFQGIFAPSDKRRYFGLSFASLQGIIDRLVAAVLRGSS